METTEAVRLLIAHGQDEALASVISTPGFDDDGVGQAYLEHRRRNSGAKDYTKGMTPMHASFRKTLIDAGYVPTIRKSIYDEALESLGDELRRPGDSDAKAYTRGMETAEGRDLFALYKAAPPDLPQDDLPEEPQSRGPAHDEMQRKADRHRAANPHLSAARAYSDVYTDRLNAELRDAVVAEHLSPRPRAPAARRLAYENPNRVADVARTMLRTRGP